MKFYIDEREVGKTKKIGRYGVSAIITINENNNMFELLQDIYNLAKIYRLDHYELLLYRHYSDWHGDILSTIKQHPKEQKVVLRKVLKILNNKNWGALVAESDGVYKDTDRIGNAIRRIVRILTARSWPDKKHYVICDNSDDVKKYKKIDLKAIAEKISLIFNLEALNDVEFLHAPKHPLSNIADVVLGLVSTIRHNEPKFNIKDKWGEVVK